MAAYNDDHSDMQHTKPVTIPPEKHIKQKEAPQVNASQHPIIWHTKPSDRNIDMEDVLETANRVYHTIHQRAISMMDNKTALKQVLFVSEVFEQLNNQVLELLLDDKINIPYSVRKTCALMAADHSILDGLRYASSTQAYKTTFAKAFQCAYDNELLVQRNIHKKLQAHLFNVNAVQEEPKQRKIGPK